jgi:hypothetical protein
MLGMSDERDDGPQQHLNGPQRNDFLGNVPPTDLLLIQWPTDRQLPGQQPKDRLLLG